MFPLDAELFEGCSVAVRVLAKGVSCAAVTACGMAMAGPLGCSVGPASSIESMKAQVKGSKESKLCSGVLWVVLLCASASGLSISCANRVPGAKRRAV